MKHFFVIIISYASLLIFMLGQSEPVIGQDRHTDYRISYKLPSSKPSNGCFLVLKKGGKRVETFFPGDEISWSVKETSDHAGKGNWDHGIIDFIGDGFININNQKVEIDKIEWLAMRRKSFHYKTGGKIMIIGGIVFLVLDPFNRVINHDPIGISATTAIVGSSFVALGIIMQWIATKKYRIGDRFSLIIICP